MFAAPFMLTNAALSGSGGATAAAVAGGSFPWIPVVAGLSILGSLFGGDNEQPLPPSPAYPGVTPNQGQEPYSLEPILGMGQQQTPNAQQIFSAPLSQSIQTDRAVEAPLPVPVRAGSLLNPYLY